MITEGSLLESRIFEYKNLLKESMSECHTDQDNLRSAAKALCKHADWTDRGANEIARLAQNYGIFMLRNALAVAIVLGMEDGKIDF